MTGLKLIFGGAPFAEGMGKFASPETSKAALEALKAGGVNNIDTAQLYGNSEEVLGKAGAAAGFVLDTKDGTGFAPVENNSKEKIIERFNQSLANLKTKQVDIFYIHAPITDVSMDDQLSAFDQLHKEGKFKRFGVSNFKAELLQEFYDHAKANNYVLPSVYQGNYNPLARKQETLLFPLLRKLNIAFYAYSPLAGGFLTKTKEQLLEGIGRFQKGNQVGELYNALYVKPELLDTLTEWDAIAKAEGIPPAELAYRWVRFNSPLSAANGDGLIFGGSSIEQINQTIKGAEGGPVSDASAKRIDAIWESIKGFAPLDNVHR